MFNIFSNITNYTHPILQHFATKLCNFTNFGNALQRCYYELYYFELFENFVYYAIGPFCCVTLNQTLFIPAHNHPAID